MPVNPQTAVPQEPQFKDVWGWIKNMSMPQALLLGQGVGMAGDLISSLSGGGARKKAEAKVTGIEGELKNYGKGADRRALKTAQFGVSGMAPQMKKQAGMIAGMNPNVDLASVYGALMEEANPAFMDAYSGAMQDEQNNVWQSMLQRYQGAQRQLMNT